MNRRNYAGNSGVIIDLCREHGIWFDAEELARILLWVRAGGTERPKQEPKVVYTPPPPEDVLVPSRSFFSILLDILLGPIGRRW